MLATTRPSVATTVATRTNAALGKKHLCHADVIAAWSVAVICNCFLKSNPT
jgi:hypothetical protein